MDDLFALNGSQCLSEIVHTKFLGPASTFVFHFPGKTQQFPGLFYCISAPKFSTAS